MAKRFIDTDIYDEDWFLSLSGQEMLFWQYICLKCDHAGIWRPNFKSFEIKTGFRINQEQFLKNVNLDQKRICVLDNGKWWLIGFIRFQYCKNNKEINTQHRVQLSALTQLENNQVDYKSQGYILRVNEISLTLKDKEKDKDILSLNSLKSEEKLSWKNNFWIYKKKVIIAYREIINDSDKIKQQQEVNPNVDIVLSLKKGIINFWGKPSGWKWKKKSKAIEIDMVSTLINSIDKNKVYLPKDKLPTKERCRLV
jgi:hypothetical protein